MSDQDNATETITIPKNEWDDLIRERDSFRNLAVEQRILLDSVINHYGTIKSILSTVLASADTVIADYDQTKQRLTKKIRKGVQKGGTG